MERFNRTLIAALTALVNEDQANWDTMCHFVTHAYNATIHASTGVTPNMLLFGEELVVPSDLQLGTFVGGSEAPCYSGFVQTVRVNLQKGYTIAADILDSTAKTQKLNFDTGSKKRIFSVGDMVVRYHAPLARLKLGISWDGPFVITEVISESTVVIRNTAR